MQALVVAVARLARALAYLGAFAVVAMMLLVSADVLIRNLFHVSFNPTPEIVARYLMVGIAFLPISWLEFRRQMISVELLDFALSPRMRKLSDISVMLLAALVYAALAWTTGLKALKETRSGTFVELVSWKMPVWHSFYLPPLGFALGSLACLVAVAALVLPGLAARLEAETHGR